MKYPESESSTLEFKESLPKNNQILKTIIGFCNQNGGKLIIGIQDDGTIKGLESDEIEKALEYLDKSIFSETNPNIVPLVYAQTIGKKTVLIIEVSAGMNKPYHIRSETIDQGTYIRLGRSTVRATPDIIKELSLASRGQPFDALPVHLAKMDDLDVHKINEFFLKRKNSPKIPDSFDKALAAYHIITDEYGHRYPTVTGILLFGKEPQRFFSDAFIICSRFAGLDGRQALATRDCTGTLFEQYEEAYSFVLSKLNRSFTITGIVRQEKLEIPDDALRESLINAIIHRNYNVNSTIRIAVFDNRIEIFSPGGFPGPLSEKTLRSGLTYTRNYAIVKIFRELGLSERLGTGLLKIFASYEEYGLKEPQIIEGENYVKYILPRSSERESVANHISEQEKEVRNLFEVASELSMADILTTLQISRTTAGRRLESLVKKGILRKTGAGSGTRYSLA